MENQGKTVVVLGASNNPDRYAYKAVSLLAEHGYTVIPVHPSCKEVNGIKVTPALSDIHTPVHTLSLYVNPARLLQMSGDIIGLRPQRVIFNPGTESLELMKKLREHNIPYVQACTLVLLRTGQF